MTGTEMLVEVKRRVFTETDLLGMPCEGYPILSPGVTFEISGSSHTIWIQEWVMTAADVDSWETTGGVWVHLGPPVPDMLRLAKHHRGNEEWLGRKRGAGQCHAQGF